MEANDSQQDDSKVEDQLEIVAGATLEIHVISGSIGESIVIRLPNGKWGVVDCYAQSLGDTATNPTLNFLLKRGVRELEFVCLTHPHSDHYRGMSHLFEAFPVYGFWRPASMTGEDLVRLLALLRIEAEVRSEADDNLDQSSTNEQDVNDLMTTLKCVDAQHGRASNKLRRKGMTGIKQLYPMPLRLGGVEEPEERQSEQDQSTNFQIWSVGPSEDQISAYQKQLRKCFGETGQLGDQVPSLRHNDISAALVIVFGKSRIVLGGDVEKANWADILSDINHRDLAADLVKVSHHGSTNGYTDQLWPLFSAKAKPVAVIAPYLKHRLPDRRAVEHIKRTAANIYVTCPEGVAYLNGPAGWQSLPAEAVMATFTVLPAARVQQSANIGTCSFIFDGGGPVISVELTDGACEL